MGAVMTETIHNWTMLAYGLYVQAPNIFLLCGFAVGLSLVMSSGFFTWWRGGWYFYTIGLTCAAGSIAAVAVHAASDGSFLGGGVLMAFAVTMFKVGWIKRSYWWKNSSG